MGIVYIAKCTQIYIINELIDLWSDKFTTMRIVYFVSKIE